MKTVKSIVLISFLLLAQFANAQVKFSKIKIKLPAAQLERKNILAIMDADHFNSEGDAIVAEISEFAQQKLKASGYQFDVLVADVTKHFVEQSKIFFKQAAASGNRAAFETSRQSIKNFISTPTFFSTNGLPPGAMGGFYTFSEMDTEMNTLVAAFPSLVQKTSIGLSVEGRNLWCLKISDNVSSDENNEPEVLYLGLQHAREAITGTSLIFFAQYLAANYATNQAVRDLVNNREIFIVPCVNPDGYVYNEINNPSGGGMQRKNRKNVGSDITGQKGVDLNRNYGMDWGDCVGASSSCGSSNTSNETYWGAGDFSEPETRAIRDLCYARNFVAAFDQHCSGPYYSLPFGRRSYHTMSAPDRDYYTFIPALMGKYNGHRAGDSYATVQYEVAGGAKDWWLLGDIESFPGEPNKKAKIYGMTGEAGGGGFWAPSNQIIELCKNLCFQNMQLAYAAGSYADIQDMDDIAITTLNPSPGFKLRRIGLGNAPVTVSIIPLQNIQSAGAAITVNSLPNYYDTYAGSVPITISASLGNEQKIKFVWKVETGGITVYDTVTKMYNPVTVFSDNMETGPVTNNWNVSGGWNYNTAFANGGARSLTESPGGDYDENDIRIAAYKNAFNLSNATATYISFWTRHRAENFRDILRLQVSINSTDGLNGTWTNLAGRNTVQESNATSQGRLGGMPALTGIRENWTKELIEIPASFYTSSNVRFRFEFSSDATAFNDFENDLDDGFYIDDFKIIKSTSPLITLPVQFISFKGQLLADETVRLDWKAVTDQQHDYFEIEKSANGFNFISIGEGPPTEPYFFIDSAPFRGNNFYRIKQADKNGVIAYSSIVSIYYEPTKFNVSIYPNPVKDIVNLKISSSSAAQYAISIIDMGGKIIHQEDVVAGGLERDISINLQKQPSQLYLIIIRNEKAEIVTTQKIIKK